MKQLIVFIKKEFKSKNITRQIIERRTILAIKLDCGHKISVKSFNVVPTKNTRCYECESIRGNEQ